MRFLRPLLAALLLPAALLAAPPARAGGDVTPVADVVGKNRAEAALALGDQGFLVATFEIAGTPPDTVAAQRPSAGAPLPVGYVVVLDVHTATTTPTSAPKAVGLSTAEASEAFGSLYALRFVGKPGDAAQRGKVVDQSPKVGESVPLRGELVLTFVADDTVPSRVPVPDVAGLSGAAAIQAVAAAGLHARVAKASAPGIPGDLTIFQAPLPGTEVDRYETVDVVVSVASDAPTAPAIDRVAVPSVVGLTEASARDALEDARLDARVEWVDGDASQTFLVADQSPEPGDEADAGSEVTLRIVRYGPASPPPGASVSLPNLLGYSQGQATALLDSLGLLPNPILEDRPGVPALRVFAQQLSPGTPVPRGTWISFRVARPTVTSSTSLVPDFYGRTKSEAIALAALAGLSIETTYVAAPTKPSGRVFSQSVSAWSLVPSGTQVSLYLAMGGGAGLVAVPDLTGRTPGQAAALLAAAGLSGTRFDVFAPGKPPLRVFAQAPLAGASVPAGTTVNYKVAKLLGGLKPVPPLVGLTKAAAVAAITAASFVADVEEVATLGKPFGRVFAQSPVAGMLRPMGATVKVRVAVFPIGLAKTVPNVLGKTKAAAAAAVAAAGLTLDPTDVFAPAKPVGKVYAQDPAPGTHVAAGSAVEVKVAKHFPAAVAVPDLLGKTKAQAEAALAAAGLTGDDTLQFAPGKPAGKVFAQMPPAGALVASGSAVAYRIAKAVFVPPGGLLRIVPNLDGLTQVQATAALSAAGLGADADVVFAFGKPEGRVFWQNPTHGTFVPSGTVVNFRVAKAVFAVAMVAVPNLLGRLHTAADDVLVGKGLVSDGTLQVNLGKPLHRVYSQFPAPGTLVATGTTVKWKSNP